MTSRDPADIRAIAEAHDHFLVEREVRTLAWFALAVIKVLAQLDSDHLAICGTPSPIARRIYEDFEVLRGR